MQANLLVLIAGCQNVWIDSLDSLGYLRWQATSWLWVFAVVSFLALTPTVGAYAQGLRPYEPLDPSKAQKLPETPISIESDGSSYQFSLEFADTPAEHGIGLMHRNYLPTDHGMLFDYQSPQRLKFWMRNTFISLDMIFIRDNGIIAFIAENTVPHSEQTIGPREPVQAVLEFPAGTVARLALKLGDVVRHPIFNNRSSP